ncbi:GGDEF domain-containing protein [Novipirellula rosea]|uniref:diguanylate cyclase n=1 Tax=Novipirellula rosea TaxID=1031540 RepID=A0ABP8MQ62_9BACT
MTPRSNPISPPDVDEVFVIAKKALRYVGQFNTPPTPEVYEVWYRFAEGNTGGLHERLSHVVDGPESVTVQQLQSLHQQFCQSADNDDLQDGIRRDLEQELQNLQLAINRQVDAGAEYGNSIEQTNRDLASPDITPQKFGSCVAEMLERNECMQSQLEEMRAQLNESQSQMGTLKRNLAISQKLTMTDPLTGVGNRRCFDSLMETAIRGRDSDASGEVALLLVDLDKFKDVNDMLGHAVGDSLLKFIASNIQKLNENATVARYGGDEFGVFLRTVEAQDALDFAQEICCSLVESRFKHEESDQTLQRVTASIGVAILRDSDTSESWFHRADKLLYCAKQDGRNGVKAERQLNL